MIPKNLYLSQRCTGNNGRSERYNTINIDIKTSKQKTISLT